ncbi:Uncharacterized protein dnl_32020 [Desulfonema limicola]|uniref:Uncharacterized protein n=1 Tax=Desulfonema limicola TaxID=45656 RepID=A0A975B8R2_9BACT|nr:hypothetical protein [Desulfonema limicola]QTA80887.1 Uncharacterized protein dnl_32020 [Desulfonema limicola]
MNEKKIAVYFLRSKPSGRDREEEFLKGELSIGWAYGESFKNKDKEEIAVTMKKVWPDAGSLDFTQCYNFATIPIGSIVLTPSLKDPSNINVFKTISEYMYKPEFEDAGNPHQIKAILVKTVKRNSFSEPFKRSMQAARRTITIMSKYIDDILKTVGHDVIDYEIDPYVPIETENTRNKSGKTEDLNLYNYKLSAKAALHELLKSDNDEIKLKAALALMSDN